MTIPHHRPQERPATAGESGAGEPRELGARQPGPVTHDDAARRYGPGTIGARERYDELSMRDHLARARARLRASGEYDAARHGSGDTEPLTAAGHLELLATAEYLARAYKPSFETDNALRAGASWAQVADALGTSEEYARVAYRAWADGQHDMLTWTDGRLGLSDAEYAEAVARAGEPEPAAAEAYAGAHWLAPGEKCSAVPEHCASEAGRGMLAPDAVATYAAMLQATEAPEQEVGQ